MCEITVMKGIYAMWIKIVLCTTDNQYARKVDLLFDKEYADKAEINIFDNTQKMLDYVNKYGADLVLYGEELEKEARKIMLEMHCVCGFLVKQLYESNDSECIYIAKYQRIDRLYKAMLNAYSKGGHVREITEQEKSHIKTKIYMFVSPNGGTGTTTIAKAFARKCAALEKTLCLDLNLMNCDTQQEEGSHGFDDIIMALKSRRNVLPLKLASAVSTDKDKVDTYAACRNPFGMFEMTGEDISRLFAGIASTGNYQKVIVDVGNHITEKEIELFKLSDEIVCVVGNNPVSKVKLKRFLELIDIMEKKEEIKVLKKVKLFKNKSGRNDLSYWDDMGCRDAGWAPDVHMDDYEACISKIAQSDAFDNLM